MSQINREHQLLTTHEPYRSDGSGWTYTIAYTGSNPTTITRTHESGDQYILTITYTGSNVTALSSWVRQ